MIQIKKLEVYDGDDLVGKLVKTPNTYEFYPTVEIIGKNDYPIGSISFPTYWTKYRVNNYLKKLLEGKI